MSDDDLEPAGDLVDEAWEFASLLVAAGHEPSDVLLELICDWSLVS